jgi:hypothetical protein
VAYNFKLPALTLLCSALLAACGGGDDSAQGTPPPDEPTEAERVVAATATADNNANCSDSAIGSFYWEIGDRSGPKASGSVGNNAPIASTEMSVASASKWIYAAYVVQKVGVRAGDTAFLNFTSGYSEFGTPLCLEGQTVGGCLVGKDGRDPDTIGKFAYDSGHMQHHAVATMGLGDLKNAELTAEVRRELGDLDFGRYSQPQLAGGVFTNANAYAVFLRRMLTGELSIAAVLGTEKVETNPAVFPDEAVNVPIPTTESWQYSLGHWVEDDPDFGDHAFSSAGALGFYPWIDATKTYYGIVARESNAVLESEAGYHSAQCGRLIRQAWVTGAEVTATTPTP